MNLTLDDAVTAVTRDLRAAGGRSYLTHTSRYGYVQITVTRPMDGRDGDEAWALAVAAGAKGTDIEDRGDHLKVPVLVADDHEVHTIDLVVQYGHHADYEPEAAPVGLIPRQRVELDVLPGDARDLPIECAYDAVVDAEKIDGCPR